MVGVTDDRQVRGVPEKTIEAVAEHCAANIEPPWVPPITAVPLGPGSGLYVLVLRVIPGQHPRPLLVNGVAPVRHHNTTHPADWQRLKDMFAETDAVLRDDPWTIHAPSVPLDTTDKDGDPATTTDLVVRSGLDFPVSREAKWRPLSEMTVAAFTNALSRSPLTDAMVSLALDGAANGGTDGFRPRGLNRSRTVTLQWWGAPGGNWPDNKPKPVEATARLNMPGSYGQVMQNLRVEIDVVVRRSVIAQMVREQSTASDPLPSSAWRVTVQQLTELIDGMLATLSSTAVVARLADLAGISAIAVPQPRVLHLVTARPITDVLNAAGLRTIPDAGESRGASLVADPARDLAQDTDRREQVMAWLTQIALDAGLLGMEELLRHLAATR